MQLRFPTALFALLAAMLATVAASPVAAQEATPDDWMHTPSAADAAAAQGQAQSALSGQTVRPMKRVAPPAAQAAATTAAPVGLTRAQVRAELQAARANGEWARLNAEVVDPAATPARTPGQPGAAPVYAERR
jgi:Domain of unknown function (DUF4148)